ncbi:hypothetical protein [Pseudonocardia acidicola]|uniref:Uncharacterized protein n=1 Tax=Pseudonocardia acidicola TaxID=2724939 RepID=A0ABX1S8B7_9PSEU|nr:hypothetical protein [Pseudonocardia acidicola]NMH97320.1 hypothetical protein [Pseudonocardia acidicola]
MTELSTGPLQRWLESTGPEHRANGHPVAPALTTVGSEEIEAIDPAVEEKLTAMRQQLALARGKAVLQRDDAWLDVLSAGEVARERWAAKRLRAMSRRQQVSAATATVRSAGRERRAEQRLARYELSDQLWQRRALARRTRLLDPTSRPASLQRTHVFSTLALLGLALAGIVWTSAGVHDALVGPDGSPLAYVVEPLFSLPLLVIMTLHARAAQWGRTFPAKTHRGKVYALEVGLLLATMLINTAPVLPGLGIWRDATTLLAHLAPPVLILVAVVLQPLAASFLAGILAEAHVDVADAGGSRMSVDTVNTLSMVVKTRKAIAGGELEPWADTGLPSVSAIARYFNCEKRKAQATHDALKMLRPGDDGGTAVMGESQ